MELPERLRIGLIQWDIIQSCPDENLAVFKKLLAHVVAGRANLVLAPEMWSRGFCGHELHDESNELASRLETLGELAQKFGVWIAAGTLPEPGIDTKPWNSFFLLDDTGEIRLQYRKIHLFSKSREPEYFCAGNDLPEICHSGPWRIGCGICFDLRFPELFRTQLLQGANLFLVPVQFARPDQELFTMVCRVRAIENVAFLCAVNRVGTISDKEFFGGSVVVAPGGQLMMRMGPREGAVVVECDYEKLRLTRESAPDLMHTPVIDIIARDGSYTDHS